MELTSTQIDRIKELASMLTPVSDIAVLMDIDERRFREILSDKSHPASLAYRKGKAGLKPEVRLPFSLLVHIFVIWTQTKTYNDLCHYQPL